MSRFELPEDWVKGLLEQAVTVKSGVGFPHKFQGKLTGDFPVYKVGDLSKAVLENDGYLYRAGNYVNADEIPQLKGEVFPRGSTLFAKIGEAVKLNRRAYVEVEGLADNNVMSVVSVIEQSKRFIYYFLKTVDLTDVSRSTTVPSIRKGDIEQLSINWPPLAEQQIIADKLDILLAQVESIKARLERIPEILKQFRQSVLAAAVSGKLTQEWRQNNGVSIDDWKKQKIGSLVSVVNGKAFPSSDYTDSGVKLLRPGNLNVSGSVIWNTKNTTYIPSDWIEKRPELIIEKWALLMNLTAQSLKDDFLGRVCIYESEERVMLNQRICSFVSKTENDITPYLYYFFKSPEFREYVDTLDTGTLIKHLNVKDVLKFEIKVPTDEEQTEIIKQIKQKLEQVEYIEDVVCNALERINNLTQSILAKAFRGELTAEWRKENPDLISGENSAEALLKRINAQRESAKSATKRGRGKA